MSCSQLPTPNLQLPKTSGLGNWVLGVCVALQVLGATSAFAQARDWPSEAPPRPLAAHDATFPPYEIRTLPNGMQVVLIPDQRAPVVTHMLCYQVGSADETPGQSGLAHFFEQRLVLIHRVGRVRARAKMGAAQDRVLAQQMDEQFSFPLADQESETALISFE